MKGFWGILAFMIFTGNLSGQCTISAKREACVNDFVAFSLSTAGSPLSYNWDFGTYGTSSNISPLMKFTSTGPITITCTVTFSGGQTCKDTHLIHVVANPVAKAVFSATNKSCLHENKICLVDSNKKAGRGIKSIALLWGDGGIDQFSVPIPKNWCHVYADTGVFQIGFEIADSNGCKDKFSTSIRISPSVKPLFTHSENILCDSVQICLKSTSAGGNSISNYWYSLPSLNAIQTNNNWCSVVLAGNNLKARLVSINEFGCKDSTEFQYNVPKSNFFLKKLDSLICINELVSGKLAFSAGEEVQWYLNGVADYIDTRYVAFNNARLGMNYLRASRIGGCKGNMYDSFEVIGVRAVGRVYNENRRRVQDTVFVVDLTTQPPGSSIIRMWDFGDSKAPQCITWTAKGQNVGKNCNFSRDSIARHYYSDSDCYAPRLIITDLISGCWDDTLIPVYRRNACPAVSLPRQVCFGDFAGFSLPGNMYNKVKNNNFLIVDTVKPSDTIVLYGGYGKYKYKTLGFKSPVLWRFYGPDTVWTESGGKIVVAFIRPGDGWVADTFFNKVEVVERSNSEFEVKKISECNPFLARLIFKDSIWRYPGTLVISWGDTVITYKQWTDSVTTLKPFDHTYKTGGFYTIEVLMVPTKGCHQSTVRAVAFAHSASFGYKSKCLGDAVCFSDSVVDVFTEKKWTKTNGFGKLKWDFGDGLQDTGYGVCHKFANPGVYKIILTATSKSGCISTYSDTIVLSAPLAGIKHQPTIYCSDIRQYFDSSVITTPKGGQIITQWIWDFADGSNLIYKKDPAHVFPSGGVFPVKLKIFTNFGCMDSAVKSFKVIGPEIKASIISDSSGCAPLSVKFANLSKNSKNYIWEFGDKNNTFYSTNSDTNTHFKYTDPGIYFIHIIGGDSFYNPTTGSRYYCSVKYPVPGQKQLRVIVHETVKTEFQAPETICIGDSALFQNTSSNSKVMYSWNFGNGDIQLRNKDTFLYRFSDKGNYKVILKPILNTGNSPCADTFFRYIDVAKITPDFEPDCQKTHGSEIVLRNTSGTNLSGFEWSILNPKDSSLKSISSQTHLQYNFLNDTGNKIICLGINGGKSCGGFTCKNVLIQGELFFANVFTPGDIDGFNDTYKTPLYGYSDFEIKIFNRWGERIFHSTNSRYEWNGKVDNTGPELPTGTYFYQIVYRPECAEKRRIVHGSINLIR